jgi:hypothetical protein
VAEHFPEFGPSWDTIPSGELEDRHKVQLSEFRSDLDHACQNGTKVVEPTDFLAEPDASKAYNAQSIAKMERELHAGGRHLYLSPEYSWLSNRSLADFKVLRTARGETSAHGVFFGMLNDPEGNRVLPVAVKPCKENQIKAYADWYNNSLVAQNSQRHFKPVGFMIGDGVRYSLTQLERGVETQDNSEWRTALADENDTAFEGQRALLKKMGKAMGHLHAENTFHGDPQFKNIAVDIAGRLFFIDWESASFFTDDIPEHTAVKKSFHDLKILFSSMKRSVEDNGVGLLSDFVPWMQWQHFKEYIFDPYMETYLDRSPNPDAFNQVAEVEERLIQHIMESSVVAVFGCKGVKSLRTKS